MFDMVKGPTVKVSSLLTKGGFFLGAVSGASLLFWLLGFGGLIFTPFASILGMVASPFMVWMGRKMGNTGRV